MIGIVLMLIIASVTPIKCNTAIDQTGLNALSVSKQTAHPSENRPNSGSRGTRDTTRIKQPKIMLSHALDHSTYSLSHLADLCPYADICDQQGRKTPSKSRASCCLPCSCDSTCRKIGNCCDKRENTGFMCYSPKLKQSGSPQTAESGYFMVDTCLDESEIDCKAENSAAWGSFYPVYHPDLELIFYNPKCAECSGAKDYTSWGLNVVCQGTNINDAYFLDVLRGKLSEKCFIKFMPPKRMIEMNHICFSGLISRCNATGLWETYNPVLEEACTRFYSPVVNNLFGMVRYSNIYCQQCNGGLPTNPEDLCTPPKLEKTTIGVSLALTIDYRQISSLVDKRIANVLKPNTDGGCREGTVKHISIENVSRSPFEPLHEKTGFLHMRKQRRRSASR